MNSKYRDGRGPPSMLAYPEKNNILGDSIVGVGDKSQSSLGLVG